MTKKTKKDDSCASSSSSSSRRRRRHHKRRKSSSRHRYHNDTKKKSRRQRHDDIHGSPSYRGHSSSYDDDVRSSDDEDEGGYYYSSVSSNEDGASSLSSSSRTKSSSDKRKRRRKSKKKRRSRSRRKYSRGDSSDSSCNDDRDRRRKRRRRDKRRSQDERRRKRRDFSSSSDDDSDSYNAYKRRKKDKTREKSNECSKSNDTGGRDKSQESQDVRMQYHGQDKSQESQDVRMQYHGQYRNQFHGSIAKSTSYCTSSTLEKRNITPQKIKMINHCNPGKYQQIMNPKNNFIRNRQICDLGRYGKWKDLLLLFEKERDQFNNVNYATMISQLARIVRLSRDDPLFTFFVEDISNQMKNRGLIWMKVRETSNIVYAIAKMKLRSAETNDILTFVSSEESSKWMVEKGNAQDVANMAWSFATLGIKATSLFTEIERRREWLVKGGSPQAVANIAWASATLHFKAPYLFGEIEKRSEWLVKEGYPQTVALTAWAFATHGIKGPILFAEMEKRTEWLVNEGSPQNVANTFWAASQFNYNTPNLAAEVNRAGEWLINDGNSSEIASISLAFATAGYYNATTFFMALEKKIDKLIKNGNVQEICNTMYSIVVLDLCKKHQKALSMLWNRAMEMNPEGFTNKNLSQLSQVFEFANVDGIRLKESSLSLVEKMKNATSGDIQSQTQKEISLLLTEIGFTHENEVSPFVDGKSGGLMSIDMVCRKRKIAIEYDGKPHFLVGLPNGEVLRKETGPTKAKRRFLQRSGWKVINLDFQDRIESAKKGKSEECKWLKKELAKVGVLL